MNIILNQEISPDKIIPQSLNREWGGSELSPPLEFFFTIEGGELVFHVTHKAPALLHPDAKLGQFQEFLWKYDTAEFFIAKEDCSRYLEFNLSPNGAWWSMIFTDPRLIDESAIQIVPNSCTAHYTAEGWTCSARIPMKALIAMDLDPRCSRMAVCAILSSPNQLFLTSADKIEGVPDFHRLPDWPLSEVK